jgi:putative ABC transport system substrate-binding protein
VSGRKAPFAYLGALALGLLLAAGPRAGEAQPAPRVARIGYLSPLSEVADAAQGEAFRQGLRALGYVEGQNVAIEARYADGRFDRLSDLAADLVRLKVDVIVAAPTPAVRAATKATQTIPIVMAFSGDPVGEGFAAGLARPACSCSRGWSRVPAVSRCSPRPSPRSRSRFERRSGGRAA